MNTSNIKKYAPKARREFMEAVAKRLNSFGISQTETKGSTAGELNIAEAIVQGSVLQINGNNFDSALAEPRRRLVALSEQMGFEQLVEQGAYTWFNRLCALRYMEIHDYLGHGLRVLSHPDNPTGFEIIDHAVDAADELALDRDYIIELKLAGNKDETLYRRLLLNQCHKLHEAMPFLFEALNDATELLLPDNLTRTDSILRGLVDGIPEEDWNQVEVIGWLYQFYISEKKDEVMGKVVKSEDIPAATQLFTPNWIVKYLVQNSVGRQWLQTYPESSIKSQMAYYIEPAEQSAEVNEQLKSITPDSIDPMSIKVLDPAVGSGHILIEAYNVLKAIYEERGFRSRDIPKLILENNLYGLDIDDRAAQLSGFALMMMAREDDKRIFTRNISLNVLALQEGNHINLPAEWRALNLSGGWDTGAPQDMFADETQDLSSFEADNRYQLLQRTLARFTHAKTFGSLIEVPAAEYDGLKEMHKTLMELAESGDSFQRPAAKQLIEFVHQALILAIRYDAVIANPPYMGRSFFNKELKKFIDTKHSLAKENIYAVFMHRCFDILKETGFNSQVNMHAWMFIYRFESYRAKILSDYTLLNMLHLGPNTFPEINGEVVQNTAFVFCKKNMPSYYSSIFRLVDGYSNLKKLCFLENKNRFEYKYSDFKRIEGSPFVYWAFENVYKAFENLKKASDFINTREGMATADNDRFLRFWYEVDSNKILGFDESKIHRWYKYNKGGGDRKWYGYLDLVVDWEDDGERIKGNINEVTGKVRSHNYNGRYAFKNGFTWSGISGSGFSVRYVPNGYMFDAKGPMGFVDSKILFQIIAFMNSKVSTYLMSALAPTLDFKLNHVLKLPVSSYLIENSEISEVVNRCINISKQDWDEQETSSDFVISQEVYSNGLLKENYRKFVVNSKRMVNELRVLEESINKTAIESYNLEGSIDCKVNIKDISLFCNSSYTYPNIEHSDELLLVDKIKQDVFSIPIGCMLGRYSLDREGLVYANSGNQGFDELVAEGAYKSFPADQNAIIPLTDQEWFKDDATDRLREFVQVVWGSEHLQENLDFIAESLCLHAIKPLAKKGQSETSLATIRRYLSTQFYKDHLKTYKKRPIYWLFSSGKNKAFECLVYLHRYDEGTLSRMRTEYVTPLLGKYDAYAEQLDKQIDSADSTSDENRFKKEQAALLKKQVELREFDDKLKHYADMRISLDLDDGVKVNYGKFGDLLSDVKSITGSAPEVI